MPKKSKKTALSLKEKKRIKKEEEYRQKIRKEIEKDKYPKSVFQLKLIISLALILLIAAVLYARAEQFERSSKSIPAQTPSSLPTPKPTSTPKPAVKGTTYQTPKPLPSPSPNPVPTERKKVAVTLTDPTVAGVWYCYEDKANEVTTAQNNLNMQLNIFNICSSGLKTEISICFNRCTEESNNCIYGCKGLPDQQSCLDNCSSQNKTCGDNCPKGTECSDKYLAEVDRLRNQLIQQKNDYCP